MTVWKNSPLFYAATGGSADAVRALLALGADPSHQNLDGDTALHKAVSLGHQKAAMALTAAGAGLFPHVVGRRLIGFVDVSARFLKGVYPGDTLYPLLEITALERQRTTGLVRMRATIDNQNRVRVLEGAHAYLLRLDAPEPA